MFKKICILAGLAGCVFCSWLMAKDISEVQSIDGGQRNQITVTSGGGGSGNATTNAGSVQFWGNTNVFWEPIFVQTNTGPTTSTIANFETTASRDSVYVRSGDSQGAFFVVGNPAGNHGRFNYSGSDTVRIDGVNSPLLIRAPAGDLISIDNPTTTRFSISSAGALTYGTDSSSTHTFNGSTFTLAHPASINSGILSIPASGGTLSNNTSVAVLNTLYASNIVLTASQAMSSIDTGTNATFTITVNGGAGTMASAAMFTSRTNSLTVALPIVNQIYTNSNQRMLLNVGLAMGINSEAAVWTVSGSQTNYFGRTSSATAINKSTSGPIQPNALYMVSNNVGTITVIAGQWNEVRF